MQSHATLQPHHKYQLEVIFLFIGGLFLFFPYYFLIEEIYFFNMDVWQWYFFWPWMTLYMLYSLRMRSKISRQERVAPLTRPLLYWIVLGIALAVMNTSSYAITPLLSVDLMYIIFTLFLADSYWDFKS
jgi:hypothetical protein